jgi:hypothetical protein
MIKLRSPRAGWTWPRNGDARTRHSDWRSEAEQNEIGEGPTSMNKSADPRNQVEAEIGLRMIKGCVCKNTVRWRLSFDKDGTVRRLIRNAGLMPRKGKVLSRTKEGLYHET